MTYAQKLSSSLYYTPVYNVQCNIIGTSDRVKCTYLSYCDNNRRVIQNNLDGGGRVNNNFKSTKTMITSLRGIFENK